MTELEKMLAGKLYDPSDAELTALRQRARRLCKAFNDCDPDDRARQTALLRELVPQLGENSWINAPVQFDYGCYSTFGARCFVNYNLTVLDCAPVTVGNDVFFGPNCSLMPPVHPLLAADRALYRKPDGTWTDREYAKPITIGNGCWIAANVVICGGV
ncbi:MAG: sugar O-acetyltransferase, partial [Clostridia bacterium]|nr:sugar O-acetyltransferase [Clostridia bacterium]